MTEQKYSTDKKLGEAIVDRIGSVLGYEIRFKPISEEYIKPKENRGDNR